MSSILGQTLQTAPSQTAPTQQSNPFANGISVAHTGANGAATNWGVTWDPTLNSYVANTGFGVAPIFTQNQWNQANSPLYANQGSYQGPAANEAWSNATPVNSVTGQPTTAGSTFSYHVGNVTPSNGLTIYGKNGATQNIQYGQQNGYWVPTSASGFNNQTSIGDQILQGAAIAGAAIPTGAALGNLMGLTSVPMTASPGAAALGGSAPAGVGGAVGGVGGAVGGVGGAAPGMTVDLSALPGQIADTAAANVAPQLAADAGAISANSAGAIAADAGAGGGLLGSLSNIGSGSNLLSGLGSASKLLKAGLLGTSLIGSALSKPGSNSPAPQTVGPAAALTPYSQSFINQIRGLGAQNGAFIPGNLLNPAPVNAGLLARTQLGMQKRP